jgi:methylthioribulose-1-phosphate dehydratase
MSDSKDEINPREVLSDLWATLHEKKWVFSSGGALTMKLGEDIYMTPKNLSPFNLKPDDIYVFDNEDVNDISEAPDHLEISPVAEIFMEIYKKRTPEAILHSMNFKTVAVSQVFRGNEYRIKNHAMIEVFKESDDEKVELTVPIVEDVKNLSEKLEAFPLTPAVLIRGKGLFIWAKNMDECVIRAEAFHQMIEFSIELEKLGLNEFTKMTNAVTAAKKPIENSPKKVKTAAVATPAQVSTGSVKPEVKKNIAIRPSAGNGVKTGRVKKNFVNNKNNRNGVAGGNFRNKNGPNNKGNSGSGGQNWQKFGKKQQNNRQQNMNVIMNY